MWCYFYDRANRTHIQNVQYFTDIMKLFFRLLILTLIIWTQVIFDWHTVFYQMSFRSKYVFITFWKFLFPWRHHYQTTADIKLHYRSKIGNEVHNFVFIVSFSDSERVEMIHIYSKIHIHSCYLDLISSCTSSTQLFGRHQQASGLIMVQ